MRRHLLALVPCLVFAVACGDTSGGGDVPDAQSGVDAAARDAVADASSPDVVAPADGGGADGATSDAGKAPLTIFTILFENHDYAEIVGSPNAPYFNQLIASYGLATNYHDSGTHPSLPNYLTLASGDPQYLGVIDLDPTIFPFPKKVANLGTQLEAAKIPWRSYQESMGTACKLSGAGTYAPKHDPFLYFDDMQNGANGLCAARNVDYGQFAADLAAGTYRFMWITPNLTNDGHDPQNDPVTGLKQADAWAKVNVPLILNSAAFQANGILFITWDEAEGRNGDSKSQIPMIVASPRLKSVGYKTSVKYGHKSWLATVEDLLGLPRLPTVANEPAMTEFFK
jgi:hypothetical protein